MNLPFEVFLSDIIGKICEKIVMVSKVTIYGTKGFSNLFDLLTFDLSKTDFECKAFPDMNMFISLVFSVHSVD